jgi:hypothetical protein
LLRSAQVQKPRVYIALQDEREDSNAGGCVGEPAAVFLLSSWCSAEFCRLFSCRTCGQIGTTAAGRTEKTTCCMSYCQCACRHGAAMRQEQTLWRQSESRTLRSLRASRS